MNDGDFIEIEFVGKVKDTGEIFDLTDAELAKKEGVFDKDHKYGPALVIVGSNSVVPGIEEKIKELKVGEEAEFEIKPDKGFGKRDPKVVQIISLNKFYEQKINPVPGAFVNIDGKNCKIQSVSGGRVRVDFNHPLAGRDLLYKVKIVRQIDGAKERLDSLLKYLSLEGESSIEGEKARVKLKNSNQIVEKIVEDSIKKWIQEVKTVEFVKPDSKETEKKKEI